MILKTKKSPSLRVRIIVNLITKKVSNLKFASTSFFRLEHRFDSELDVSLDEVGDIEFDCLVHFVQDVLSNNGGSQVIIDHLDPNFTCHFLL